MDFFEGNQDERPVMPLVNARPPTARGTNMRSDDKRALAPSNSGLVVAQDRSPMLRYCCCRAG